MATKKYVSLSKLSDFLDNLKNVFAYKIHAHTVSDISDYVVDSQLSSTSSNPVENRVIDAEFEAIGDAMGALELAIDNKAESSHNHDDKYYTETEIDGKLDNLSEIKADTIQHRAGSVITVDNSAYAPVKDLKIYGKTTQNGTELETVGESGSIGVTVTDGTESNVQTLIVQTPNGLAGIPVSSGGNYTDTSGQQRLCDYKDCANGVTVKRINTKVFDGTEDFDASGVGTDNAFFGYRLPANVKAHIVAHDCISMCSHFQKASIATSTTTQGYLVRDMSGSDTTRVLFRPENVASMTEATFKTLLAEQHTAGTPVTVQYELETPVETPMTAEEKAQYAALHTNNPYTTVYNDSGAHMEIKYYTPSTAVQMVHSPEDQGKYLSIDEHGCVILKEMDTSGVGADVSAAIDASLTAAKKYTDDEITEWVGTKKVSEQISTAISGITHPVTKVNNKTGNVTLAASDVGAVPTTRTVNGKALSANVTITATELFAAGVTKLSSYQYGSTLPSSGTAGQIFFLLDE